MKKLLSACAAAVACCGAATAAEYAPRVLSPHHADAYSMKTFGGYSRWKDLAGDDKAYALFAYLADRQTGVYPMGIPAREGRDVMYEYTVVRDPVKLINVYAASFCDTLGPMMEGVVEGVGLGRGRTVDISNPGHVVAEVELGGRWAYLDVDLRGVFRRPDGTLASMAEACRDPSLWQGGSRPLFFPMDNPDGLRKSYAAANVTHRYGVHTGGHTMDYVLRRGETFTRWWQPQGQRWNHHESFHKGSMGGILKRDPPGPKCKHAGYTVHSHGNGRFVYRPDLRQAADVADGLHDGANVVAGPGGLMLAADGEGFAVFAVRSPYVIVPEVNQYETPDDDASASVVTLDASGASLRASTDNGITWSPVSVTDGQADLTKLCAGTYGYLLRVDLKGKAREAGIKALAITTWVELQPASLPAVRSGVNLMRYVTGDHHGLKSSVVEIRTNGSDRDDFLKYCAVPPADFDPARKTSRARGVFVAQVAAPPGMKIAWFSAGGAFNTWQLEHAAKAANTLAWAVDAPEGFVPFHAPRIPTDQNHWHYNADVEVVLPKPAARLFIQYTGNPGVNNLRLYAHCVEDAPRPATPVQVTHVWSEQGVEKRKTVTLDDDGGTYEIDAGTDPRNLLLEFSVPSAGAPEA